MELGVCCISCGLTFCRLVITRERLVLIYHTNRDNSGHTYPQYWECCGEPEYVPSRTRDMSGVVEPARKNHFGSKAWSTTDDVIGFRLRELAAARDLWSLKLRNCGKFSAVAGCVLKCQNVQHTC